MRALLFTALITSLPLIGGCCGRFVHVECMSSTIQVEVLGLDGAPVAVEAVTASLDGGEAQPLDCIDESPDGACWEWATWDVSYGHYQFDVYWSDDVIASADLEVIETEANSTSCCGDVITEDVRIEIDEDLAG